AGSGGTGTPGRLPRQAGNPRPGQGCCEAGKRQVRGHRRILVIRRNGTAPAVLARRELGDQRAANLAAERALALAESDRLLLPFAMTGTAGLLEALPRHQTARAALLADILGVLHGSSPAARQPSSS